MMLANPAVLRDLVEQFQTLRALHGEDDDADVRQRLDDIAYTLCVSTGTRDVETALRIARHQLPGAHSEDDALTTACQ
ncbi:DUF5133 domain-containing protein [Streptomyces flavidovirens]|uniref:DUF5133 domain-containing protein n=1 Tax=Streptomyces flavidovirens TaxID=67298 RepID=UPI0036762A33